MSPGRPTAFHFPAMTEEQLRRERLRAFWSSAAAALGPYLAGVAWHLSDGIEWTVLYLGIPDLALGGVVIAIAAYSNTILSFTKLDGWSGISRATGFAASMVGVLAVFSSVQYFKAAYSPGTQHNQNLLFYISLFSTIGTFTFAFLLQHTFVSDECRWARKARQHIG